MAGMVFTYVEIDVGVDNDGAFPAEFQDDGSQMIGSVGHDNTSHFAIA